jgi:4-amino-4-deoxy-L-arabinose transferase-like glycosyltransferase
MTFAASAAALPLPASGIPCSQSRFSAVLLKPSWLALLLPLCGFLFFYGLTTGELYRTESLRAILASEVLRTGNCTVPTLYGEPLLTKPPGMYVAIALVSWPFGEVSEATARLPSAIAATITVWLFFWYFNRQLGRLGGLLIAIMLPTTMMWLDKAPSAEIDMLQVAWVAAALLFFLRALEDCCGEEETRRRGDKEKRRQGEEEKTRWGTVVTRWGTVVTCWGTVSGPCPAAGDLRSGQGEWSEDHAPTGFSPRLLVSSSPCLLVSLSPCLLVSRSRWWLAALLCVAGGVLTKWTAPAFFYFTVVPLLWWRKQLRLLFGWPHLLAAAVGAAICFTWAGVAIAQTGWDLFYQTVSREALMRLSPAHHNRPYPWHEVLGHPFIILGANLPWSAFALLALRPSFFRLWDERGRRLLQALHCWTWPNLLFWTVIPEHAARHSMPLCSGLAGLSAMVWLAWLTGRLPWPWPRVRPVPLLAGFLACWLVVKVAFVQAVIPMRNGSREPREKAAQIAALVPEGQTLYLFHLKDEGIMFYYGRPVRRLAGPDQLPSSSEPLYCILAEKSDVTWPATRSFETLLRLTDEQGDPLRLVRSP